MNSVVRISVAVVTFSAVGFAGIVADEHYTSTAIVPTKNDRPTVGFGSTFREDGSPVRMGDTIDPPRAVQRSVAHIQKDETGIRKCFLPTASVSQVEWDILIDFVYQYGVGRTCNSSMVRHINAGNYEASCRSYPLYKYSGGFDCSLPENHRICGGVHTRNLKRQAKCLAAQ